MASEIEPFLIDGQFFVPEEIGLKSLVPEQMNSDDHLLHEFQKFRRAIADKFDVTKFDFMRVLNYTHKMGWFRKTNSRW